MLKSFQDIKHVLYINLDRRRDRREHVERELALLGFYQPQRFRAIAHSFGTLGCSLSHLACLRMAMQEDWPHVMIVEDDILFIDKPRLWEQIDLFLKETDTWDVLLLGGNNIESVTPSCAHSVRVSSCQTTTGYIVQRPYYETLIANVSLGVGQLLRQPHLKSKFAIDQFWRLLQKRDRWFLLLPLIVTQTEGYSDIEKKRVEYNKVMLVLNK